MATPESAAMVDPMSVTISKQLNRPRRMVDMKFLPDPW